MTRLSLMLAAGLVSAFAAAVPASAQGAGLRAEFATPFEQSTEVVVDGRMWSCGGTVCTAQTSDPRPAVACRKLARKVGTITRFSTAQTDLNAAGLATCNQDRN